MAEMDEREVKPLVDKIKNFSKQNKLLIFLFLVSTSLFCYEHSANLSWDFSAYVLNAKYLFYNGTYFETLRPPMVPLLLAPFLIFGVIGEYLYIILVSCLFFYSSIKLSDTLFKNQDKYLMRFAFYLFSLGTFQLHYSIFAGSELLGLVFFELFLVQLLTGKVSGFYFGLAFLTRYNFLIFFPLLFLNKDYKKIIKNLLLFLAVVFPWFLFNYIHFGNWFTSFVDAYANNVLFRDYIHTPLKFMDVFSVFGLSFIFFIIGIIFWLKDIRLSKQWFKENLISLFFIILFFFIIWDYSKIPLKDKRYLFNLILPIAFFSVKGVIEILKLRINYVKEKVIFILIILFLISSLTVFMGFYRNYGWSDSYLNAANDIKSLGIENCEILAPDWVLVTYYTENVYPLGKNPVNQSLKEGKIILIFEWNGNAIDDTYSINELESNFKLLEKRDYVFYVKPGFSNETCAKKYVFDETYVRNHCEVISSRFKKIGLDGFVKSFCDWIN